MKTTNPTGLSRRKFLHRTTGGAVSLAILPSLVSASVLGRAGTVPPSERIVMGATGLGGRGTYDMGAFMNNADVQMVAVCEVNGARRQAGKARVDRKYGNADCQAYRDLRDLLARPDIDAVLFATGDNWHSMATILACRAGKDIYCEKPLSITIAESRAVVNAVHRHARVFQCGTQRRNIARFRFAVELAQSGRLGKLQVLQAEKAPMNPEYDETWLAPEPEPDKEVFDWNQWLGPAAWRPYNHIYPTRGFWGANLDFSGGAICEWGSHTADLCQWANNADDTGPVEFEPWQGSVVAHYANGVRLEFVKGVWPLDVKFIGSEGWVYVDDDGNLETHPASLRAHRKFGTGYPAENHVRQFLDCVKSRAQPISHAEVAHRSITVCHAANLCLRLNRPLRWNPAKEEFVGDDQANRLRARTIREPWQI